MTNLLLLQEELEALRAKFEKVDKERQELKQHNEKLDSRVSFSLFIFTHFCWLIAIFLTVKSNLLCPAPFVYALSLLLEFMFLKNTAS